MQGDAAMDLHQTSPRRPFCSRTYLVFCVLTTLLITASTGVKGQQAKVDVLRIGSSGSMSTEKSGKEEKSAIDTLRNFIKEETGLNNEIQEFKDWQEVGDQLTKGKVHLGVFQGYEYAWAQEKYPALKPLALAINVHRNTVAYVVTQRDNKVKDFAGLQGKTFSIPASSPRFLRLFVEHQCQAAGKKADTFFAKITSPESIEDALDDVVDGTTQATVIDRAALEAFKQRKPGRFKKLKEVAHSQPIPPPVIAYYGNYLDEATRNRFKVGLLAANKKEKGEMMLTLFRLTHFETPTSDFGKVVAQTQKAYPPPNGKGK